MRFKVLACDVFFREISCLAATGPHTLDVEYFNLGKHVMVNKLREELQQRITAAEEGTVGYDAILLAYALCGGATTGLVTRKVPLVYMRAHDCCTVLLGSRKRFEKLFKDMPSTPFSSVGYMERGKYFFDAGEIFSGDSYEALVEKYGEEDARYIYDAMHPTLDGELLPIYYIDIKEVHKSSTLDECRDKAAAEGRSFHCLAGSLSLLRKLLWGEWDDDEFLVLQPGERARNAGDWDRIVEKEDLKKC